MLFLLFLLIQAQEQPRLSKIVIAGVALFLILGVYLLVYFLRRLRSGEKEPEEDWSLSRRSLFVEESAAASAEAEEQTQESEPRATEILASPASRQTSMLASEPSLKEPPAPVEPEPTLEPKTETPAVSIPPSILADEPEKQNRGTELLTSPQPEIPEPLKAHDTLPFDDEIWAGLEIKEEPAPVDAEQVPTQQTIELRSPFVEPANNAQPEKTEPEQVARIEQRATREMFEPPRIEQVREREPFEPPVIKPLTPREQAEARERQAASKPTRDLYAVSPQSEDKIIKPVASDKNLYGQTSALDSTTDPQPSTRYESRPTRELAADPDLSANAADAWQTVNSRAPERRAPAGVVLGLPREAPHGPMVLGTPVKPADEIGIGSLSNYGKPIEKYSGRGGTVALLLAVLIIGGALAAYFFIPSVHSKVDGWVARVRGVDPNAANISAEPKAMIFPTPSEPDKNIVKARGAISNISAQMLENLEVEISLERADKTFEIRNIAITPSQIEPNGRGTYEFEYDGNRETGFVVYKIKRLLSNGNPVRFTSPGQK